MTYTRRPKALRALIYGTLMVLLGVAMALKLAGLDLQAPPGFIIPGIAFEFSLRPEHAARLIPSAGAREAWAAWLNLDTAFLIASGLFLTHVAHCLLPAGNARKKAVLLAVAAAIANVWENHHLAMVINDGPEAGDYWQLHLTVVAKYGAWAMLAAALLPGLQNNGALGQIASLACVAVAITTAGAFLSPAGWADAMQLALVIQWAMLLWLMLAQLQSPQVSQN